jgi:hypothetical protein
LRIALEKVRLLATLGFVAGAACVLVPGTSAAFSASSLTGGYGCLAHVTLQVSSGTLQGISEIMRLGFDGAGNVKGKIVLNLQGEVCNIATTGTYSVGGDYRALRDAGLRRHIPFAEQWHTGRTF